MITKRNDFLTKLPNQKKKKIFTFNVNININFNKIQKNKILNLVLLQL